MSMNSTACRLALDKAAAGGRLSVDEALVLAREANVHELGMVGLAARERRFGRKAFWVYNQHVNFTNICRNACTFCAFSKRLGQPGAYTNSVAQIVRTVAERLHEPITEIHVVGGLNPKIPFAYYEELLRELKAVRPNALVKAFTAVEIAHLADAYGMSQAEVLTRLKAAGLDAMPGGGAEVFNAELRSRLCPEKISGDRWLEVHRTAHACGIPTNATMLFGHIETWEHRIEHMAFLRDLQDETNGFVCFIPLAYQPGNNPLGTRGATGPDGVDFLRTIALARIFLDNIAHLKAYWVMCGVKAAQMALWAGADDFDGTVVEERIGHAAGASSPTAMTVAKLRDSIAQAGFEPVERNAYFREVQN